MGDPRISHRTVQRVTAAGAERREDAVAVERPLEIRVDGRALAVTLRTPGDDEDLVLGFLASEGAIARRTDVAGLRVAAAECPGDSDRAELALAPGVRLDWARLERHFAASSACGLCGRAHLDVLRAGLDPAPPGPPLDLAALAALPERLRAGQRAFTETGGLHAAAWCDEALAPRVLREDVGRHNAVDKVAGWLLARGEHPAGRGVLWVSGRIGAEIVLKAARARIPVLAAVGAPSTLAVDLARAAGMALVGFLREGRMNAYAGAERLGLPAQARA
uniref:Sulfur carrier protein FdhD n=1 Tax=Eiseniibacteriota bacterium TaxID=2212470 RepID=A0A832MJP5_UNCEI